MSIFYVDFENVNDNGLEGLSDLTSEDKVVLFYQKDQKISINRMTEIANSPVQMEYRRTELSRKNYLDFQLSTYLGYCIAQLKDEHFVIISKDSGFDGVVDFWKNENINIERLPNLCKKKVDTKTIVADCVIEQTVETKAENCADTSLPERYRKKMRPVLKKFGLPTLKYTKVYKAVLSTQKVKEYRKQLAADFGDELGKNIYDYTQSYFSEYWKNKLG